MRPGVPLAQHHRAGGRGHGDLAHHRHQDRRRCEEKGNRGWGHRARRHHYGFPAPMNELIGTRFKIVTGYDGGNQINLAMERGEVEARNNSWSSWKATKADWLRDKKIAIIAQAGPRAPDLDAPSVEDAGRTPEEKQLIELVVSGTQLG